ncbi:MAG: hypothetical protein NC124_13090 [Clostridium sp.]|nr:hypothetical protein [Clostridium sp.]
MSVNGIAASAYPLAGYETKRTGNNGRENFAGHMGNVNSTGNTAMTLHISNEEDGQSIGAMADHDSSVTVYRTKDFDLANPVYKVKIWDSKGNVTERMVDISKVAPESCDKIDMFAYASHLTATGECPDAQSAFIGAKSYYNSTNEGSSLFDKNNWLDIVKDIMQMQYHSSNLQGYLHYKQFWDFLNK